MLGQPEPRLWTPEARKLTRSTTRGYEVTDFAESVIGEPLMPWQRWLVTHALELNPDGTYRFRVILVLVARQNGKTHLLRTVSLWRLFVDNARLVLGAAQSLDIAREAWQSSVDTAKSVPDLAAEVANVRYANGEQSLNLTNGARYRITAATRGAGRGLSVDQLNLDEVREQRDWLAWGALSKTTMARANGQIWAISNQGDDQSVVLNQLRAAALAGSDPSIFLAEWSAPDGCELDDIDAIAQANPALGHPAGISLQAITTARTTDPPAVYRTEVLCQRVDTLEEAVDISAWRDCLDPIGSLDAVRDRVCLCLDVAPDGLHATLSAAAVLDDGRVRVEPVAAWQSADAARFELPDLIERIKPRATGWFPSGPAAVLAPLMQSLGAVEIKGQSVLDACMGLADLVTSRRVVHPGDPLAYAHLSGAQRLKSGDGWRFTRNGPGHVDAAYSVAGSVWLALTQPPEVPTPRVRIIVGRRVA